MLAVVKKPHTNSALFEIKGDIPDNVMDYLSKEFGQSFEIFDDDSEELVDVFETAWYQKIHAETTPGDVVHIYRENLGLTQAELGQKIGNSEDVIAAIEANKRPITPELAEKLSQIFDVAIERFM